jgi:hypothetical protein
MRMRTLVAVVLLVLASAALTGVGQQAPSIAAPLDQIGMLRAAIHAGSCADPETTVVLALNPLAPSGQPEDAAAPLLSYTEAPVSVGDLSASPHALIVSLGGDVDAAIACGDLDGDAEGGLLSVTLREQNASGFAGVALLTDAGGASRISVVLAETPHIPSTPPSPPPVGTPLPIETPSPDQPPAVFPGLTPAPIVTPPAPAGETPVAGPSQESPYVSEQFGYAVAFDPPWQVVLGPEVDATSDYIVLSNGTSFVDFLGFAAELSAPACMDRLYDEVVLTRPGLRLVVPHAGSDRGAMISTPEQTIEVWDITYLDEAGESVPVTFYANCTVLQVQDGQSVLLTTHESPRDEYAAQAALREQLYAGVSLP